MREVLADAGALLEHFGDGSADGGFTRRVLDVAVQLGRELLRADENRLAFRKALGGVVRERLLEAHVRRFMPEARCIEFIA